MKRLIIFLFLMGTVTQQLYPNDVPGHLIEAKEPRGNDYNPLTIYTGLIPFFLNKFFLLLQSPRFFRETQWVTVPASLLQKHLAPETAQMMQSVVQKAGLSPNLPIHLSKGGWIRTSPNGIHIDINQWNAFTLPEQKLVMGHECIHMRDHHGVKRVLCLLGGLAIPLGLFAYDTLSFKCLQWLKQKCTPEGKWYRTFNAMQKCNHTISSHWITNGILFFVFFITYSRHQERQADIKGVTELGADPLAVLSYQDHKLECYRANSFFHFLDKFLDEHPTWKERKQYLTALANSNSGNH